VPRAALWVLPIATLSLASCSDTRWTLPVRDDEAVRAEEARLAEVVARVDGVVGFSLEATCVVRLLGSDDGASLAWAVCDSADGSRVSLPVRVTGDTVDYPQDATYQDDVEAMFPPSLVDFLNPSRTNDLVDDLVDHLAR
jgi:hypothetical protein